MPDQVDVIIVGGGMAGASAAFFLADKHSVLLLEAEDQCGYHTTGRSAAVFEENYGTKAIREITRASRDFYERPPEGFVDVPLLHQRGWIFVANQEQLHLLDSVAEELEDAGLPPERHGPEFYERHISIAKPGYAAGCLWNPVSSDIDVDALHQAFLRGLKSKGGKVVTRSRVDSLRREAGLWHVGAGEQSFSGSVLINAAGAWADELGQLAGCKSIGLVPKRRTAMLLKPPQDLDVMSWPAVVDAEESFYFKPQSGLLLASMADATPSPACDAQPEEIDVATTIYRVQQAIELPESRPVKTWAGLRSFVDDGTPVVGYDPEVEGFFWLAGQGGYGIQTAPMMGQLVAELVDGNELPTKVVEEGLNAGDLSPQRL